VLRFEANAYARVSFHNLPSILRRMLLVTHTQTDDFGTDDDKKLRCQYCGEEQSSNKNVVFEIVVVYFVATTTVRPKCDRDDCGHRRPQFNSGHWLSETSPCHL
jgi:hypothetical protein